MNAKPTLVTIPPRELRERLQSDPQLLALLARGYTIATSCVLVDGPEGPEQRMDFALVLTPPVPQPAPQPQPPAQVVLPRWLAWVAGAILTILLALLACAVALAVSR